MEKKTVYKIREFNRLYMPVFNLLGNRYLGSAYSATEARVLFEIYENDGCNAVYVAKKMNIDKSYLSRVIKNHEKSGYVTRILSQTDSRSYDLHLTASGMVLTEDLINKSNEQIAGVIGSLKSNECAELVAALDTVLSTLQKCVSKGVKA